MLLKKELQLISKIILISDIPKIKDPIKLNKVTFKTNIQINKILEDFFIKKKNQKHILFKPIYKVIRNFCLQRTKLLEVKKYSESLYEFLFHLFTINFFLISILKKYILISCNFILDEKQKIKNKTLKTAITINFPEHAFSINKNKYKYPSSFAETLNDEGISKIISYNLDKRKNISLNFKNKNNYEIKKQYSFINLIKNIKYLLKLFNLLLINKNFPLVLRLSIFENELEILFYTKLVNYINIYNSHTDLFFLSFNNPFPINFNRINNTGIYEFHYSDSIFCPPMLPSDLKYANYKLKKYLPYSVWGISNHGTGFKSSYELANKRNKKYLKKNLKFLNKNSLNLKPTFLGYKSKTKLYKKNNIILFDIYPVKAKENLLNMPTYSFFDDYYYVSIFLKDIVDTLPKNLNIFLKPKYSFSSHQRDYLNLIFKLRKKYKNFKILDPYTDILSNVSNIKMSISIPFTSPHQIMLNAGVESIYYCPEEFKHLFKDCKNKNFITSKKQLLSRLK